MTKRMTCWENNNEVYNPNCNHPDNLFSYFESINSTWRGLRHPYEVLSPKGHSKLSGDATWIIVRVAVRMSVKVMSKGLILINSSGFIYISFVFDSLYDVLYHHPIPFQEVLRKFEFIS